MTTGKQAHTCSGLSLSPPPPPPNLRQNLFLYFQIKFYQQNNITKDCTEQNRSKVVISLLCEVIPADFHHFQAVKPLTFSPGTSIGRCMQWGIKEGGWEHKGGTHFATPSFPIRFSNDILLWVCTYRTNLKFLTWTMHSCLSATQLLPSFRIFCRRLVLLVSDHLS